MKSVNIRAILYSLLFVIPYKGFIRISVYWNKLILIMLNIKHGHKCKIRGITYIKKKPTGIITIGDCFVSVSGLAINPLSCNKRSCFNVEDSAEIVIGNNVGISSSTIWAATSIKIGDNVKIGANSVIMDTDAHSLDYLHRRTIIEDQEHKKNKPIVIGNDVLIGTCCIILKGVKIGARSIIGSGSVVTKDIPADCIAAGNPCKILRYINKT